MALKFEPWDAPDGDKPKPPQRNGAGGMAIFALGIAIVMAAIFVPSLSQPLRKMLDPPPRPQLDANATVWVVKNAGDYYCPGSRLYGRGTGSYMKQGEALTAGYQPALGTYCMPVKTIAPKSRYDSGERAGGSETRTSQPRNSTVFAAPRP